MAWWLVAGGWGAPTARDRGSGLGSKIGGRLMARQLVASGWGVPYGAIETGTGTPGGGLPHCHFDRNAVEWRNLTAQCAALRWEISRLRAAIEL